MGRHRTDPKLISTLSSNCLQIPLSTTHIPRPSTINSTILSRCPHSTLRPIQDMLTMFMPSSNACFQWQKEGYLIAAIPRPSICLHPYRESKPLESTKQPSRRPRLLKHFPTKAFPGLPLLPICSRKIIMKGLQKRHLRVKDLVSSLTSRMIKKVISPKNKKTPTSPNCGPYIFTIDWHY